MTTKKNCVCDCCGNLIEMKTNPRLDIKTETCLHVYGEISKDIYLWTSEVCFECCSREGVNPLLILLRKEEAAIERQKAKNKPWYKFSWWKLGV